MGRITRVTSLTTVGGDFMPGPALDAVAAGAVRGIDLLVGTTLEEATLFGTAFEMVAPDVAAAAFGSTADDVLAAYGPAHRFLTDAMFRVPAIKLAQAAQPHSPRTYMYLLTYASPASGTELGAVHGSDLPFIWDTIDAAGAIFEAAGKAPSQGARHGDARRLGGVRALRDADAPGPAGVARLRPPATGHDAARRHVARRGGPDGRGARLWDGVRY